jgi:hypothetical protein
MDELEHSGEGSERDDRIRRRRSTHAKLSSVPRHECSVSKAGVDFVPNGLADAPRFMLSVRLCGEGASGAAFSLLIAI